MKIKFRTIVYCLGLLVIVVMALALPAGRVHAQGVMPADEIFKEILQLVSGGFAALVGVPALVAALINILKTIGVVKDATAGQWSAGLSLAAFIAVIVLRVFRPDIMLDVLDGYAGQIAQIIIYVLGFVVMMFMPAVFHARLKGAQVPVLGKSYSK